MEIGNAGLSHLKRGELPKDLDRLGIFTIFFCLIQEYI